MPNYDFSILSPIEFEDLVRDLVQVRENQLLESFGEGQDQGIDFKKDLENGELLIVQAKRYGSFSSLKASLDGEVEKMRIKKPKRYILATSVSLNPTQKTKIEKMFAPFIIQSKDILGKEDLNNILGEAPKIEERHYKLWMGSTNILETILNRNVTNRATILKDEILEDLKLFVQNESFNKALKVLEKHNIVIVSGNPGVGKTTLAKMINYHLMSKGYDLIEISMDIEEGFKSLNKGRKQVFFYDDFMGQNFLESGSLKNEEKRLIKFMEHVNKSDNKMLVMTTREYILNQAKLKLESLNKGEVDNTKFVLDLAQYKNLVKAEILYNHLYFSGLPKEFIKVIAEKENYKKIIEHPNYNPRVIKTMTTIFYPSEMGAEEYKESFFSNLNNPEEIWMHAFENQINTMAQYILYALLLAKDAMFIDDLKIICENICWEIEKTRRFNFHNEFKKALKELSNTFISIDNKLLENGSEEIYFQNPSIKDFLLNYISKQGHVIEALLESAFSFEQLFHFLKFKNNHFHLNMQFHSYQLNSGVKKKLKLKLMNEFERLAVSSFEAEDKLNWSHLTFLKLNHINKYYDYSDQDIVKVGRSLVLPIFW